MIGLGRPLPALHLQPRGRLPDTRGRAAHSTFTMGNRMPAPRRSPAHSTNRAPMPTSDRRNPRATDRELSLAGSWRRCAGPPSAGSPSRTSRGCRRARRSSRAADRELSLAGSWRRCAGPPSAVSPSRSPPAARPSRRNRIAQHRGSASAPGVRGPRSRRRPAAPDARSDHGRQHEGPGMSTWQGAPGVRQGAREGLALPGSSVYQDPGRVAPRAAPDECAGSSAG